MLLPWKKSRGWHPSSRETPVAECLPGGSRLVPDSDRLETTVDGSDAMLAKLDDAIAKVCVYLTEKSVPSAGLINPMLEVWEAANAIHPAVAGPVEEFLTVLIHRTSVAPAEINAVADDVKVLALQASVLAGGMTVS
jgi:hypothetical protein